ncbi:FKBP-type peptidyl-prolyl cis-trans isomerase [Parabacteroides acidifaciens]|uniref:Peptidyl-prolyl cis-trans isomerase n=1 Tax=Parabacteroides acidifaciens TaxID=2290935 RepID=A0A3D8HK12_9BACT|nr:FKBP-type peptidyl-prolyl cis-trans isomerase [Parabacteroides acidifaciens]MBC8600371.1 FKBP-type peptidyl-prolyl cis-trans isomerase [Parabacteroides acidifaciens]RDU51000.1 peptidylprolyl isomerase [Parabacteroides acidifaciens]
MKRTIYAAACLMMVLLIGFTACGDDDNNFSAEQIAYFEKNRDYIREKKALKGEDGELLYKQVVLGGDTALYRVLSKEGTEMEKPTRQTTITVTLKGDFINNTNFQPEMSMPLTPVGVVPGLGAILLENTVGERVEAIIPAYLGYGYYDNRGIPAGSTLIFTYTVEKFN